MNNILISEIVRTYYMNEQDKLRYLTPAQHQALHHLIMHEDTRMSEEELLELVPQNFIDDFQKNNILSEKIIYYVINSAKFKALTRYYVEKGLPN